MFISLVSFGFLGGISGVVLGTEQINMLMHNTFYVPGHFHTTVVTGTTLAFMSITYLLVPVLFRREMILPKLCQIQPYLFGIGMSITGLVMMGAGTLGVSRRHWDMAFSGSPFQYEWPGAAYLMMGLTGVFGVITIIGGGMWILLVVGSLLFGKKLEGGPVSDKPTPIPDQTMASAASHSGSEEHTPVPGTVVLAMLLLVSFVLYYYVNLKYLSEVWLLS
jgi:cytochrome c oxidase subunit 1